MMIGIISTNLLGVVARVLIRPSSIHLRQSFHEEHGVVIKDTLFLLHHLLLNWSGMWSLGTQETAKLLPGITESVVKVWCIGHGQGGIDRPVAIAIASRASHSRGRMVIKTMIFLFKTVNVPGDVLGLGSSGTWERGQGHGIVDGGIVERWSRLQSGGRQCVSGLLRVVYSLSIDT